MADDPKKDEPLNSVVITREVAADGKTNLSIGTTGDVRDTEKGDILAYALAIHRATLGV